MPLWPSSLDDPYAITGYRRFDVLKNGRGGLIFVNDAGRIHQKINIGTDEAEDLALIHTLKNLPIVKDILKRIEKKRALDERVAQVYQEKYAEADRRRAEELAFQTEALKYGDYVAHVAWELLPVDLRGLEPPPGCPQCKAIYDQWSAKVGDQRNKTVRITDAEKMRYLNVYDASKWYKPANLKGWTRDAGVS